MHTTENEKPIVLGEQVIYKYTPRFICPNCNKEIFYHWVDEKEEHIKHCKVVKN